jgi:hypothetical protein
MRFQLCIVSVYRPDMYDEARNALSLGQNVEVIIDRRLGERRSTPRGDTANDRRRRKLDDELRTEGYAIVAPE